MLNIFQLEIPPDNLISHNISVSLLSRNNFKAMGNVRDCSLKKKISENCLVFRGMSEEGRGKTQLCDLNLVHFHTMTSHTFDYIY